MKIVVTGGDGQLGRALSSLQLDNIEIVALNASQCDVTNWKQVCGILETYQPNVVIHCAAYTAVDRAETEKDICRKINVTGTQYVAEVCKRMNITMVLLSTDYVFDGTGDLEQPTEQCRNALNQYGQSKIDAEDIVMELSNYYIVRTSWMFGDGNNFVKTISTLGREKKSVFVVDDQIGSPTYAEDLAHCLLEVIQKAPFGIYHVTNEGFCSWADLAEMSFKMQGILAQVNRISSDDYVGAAKRPKNSRLSKECLDFCGIARLPRWEDGLKRYLQKCGKYCDG